LTLREFILGRRLANREWTRRKIGALEAIPAMGLDGLGSSAYGPEAALTMLVPLGAAALSYVGWIMASIMALLCILFVSYWQTTRAYPTNGGAYTVAKENLGSNASLLAAAALMIDYVLNVAVGISAGVAALTSALPQWQPHALALCIGILIFIALMNLRGTLDAGRLFAVPTYLFIASFLIILVYGSYKTMVSGGHPQALIAPAALPPTTQAMTIWLFLRAFASGCTAMTGVEAVSNGMSAFREPAVKHGHRTLAFIVVTLGVLLAGIAYLASAYRIGAMDQTQAGYRSVLSQLAAAVVGQGVLYYVAMASLLSVLALSANTSFVDFPRLCRAVAQDGYLPKSFAIAGRRLVFSVGILYLTICAAVLLILFGGITDRLIPLFAIGAFMTFTLSQAGMVMHWRKLLQKERRRVHRVHMLINFFGTVATAAALCIIIVAKFSEGAWITLAVIPCVLALLKAVRRYYDDLAAHTRDATPLSLSQIELPVVLVAIDKWNKLADKAITLALSLSPDVIGVHLTQLSGPDSEERHRSLQQQWRVDVEAPALRAGLTPPRLTILQAPFRTIHEPVLKLAEQLQDEYAQRPIAVLIPELVRQHWYQHLLHTGRGARLRRQLVKHGGARLTIISVPWRLTEQTFTKEQRAEHVASAADRSIIRRAQHEVAKESS